MAPALAYFYCKFTQSQILMYQMFIFSILYCFSFMIAVAYNLKGSKIVQMVLLTSSMLTLVWILFT